MDFSAAMRNLRSKKFWFPWLGVMVGAVIMSAGFVLFTNPYKIIPGGVYGLGRVFHYLVPSIQTGTFGLMMDHSADDNRPYRIRKDLGAKTVFAALVTPLVMNGMTNLVGENPDDGTSFISQFFNFSDNLLVAAIFGGVLIGAGVGIIVKFGATSGGTDIISMLLSKFMKMKFSTAMFIVESSVVVIGMIILRDWSMPLYALISIFVAAQVTDFVLDGASYDKLLFYYYRQERTDEGLCDERPQAGRYLHQIQGHVYGKRPRYDIRCGEQAADFRSAG